MKGAGWPPPRGDAEWRPSSPQTVLVYKRRRPRRRVADLPLLSPRPPLSERPFHLAREPMYLRRRDDEREFTVL